MVLPIMLSVDSESISMLTYVDIFDLLTVVWMRYLYLF